MTYEYMLEITFEFEMRDVMHRFVNTKERPCQRSRHDIDSFFHEIIKKSEWVGHNKEKAYEKII
jgi:hypothetical protein